MANGQTTTFARLAASLQIEFFDIRPHFSNFQFVDDLLSGGDYCAVRRLFSLARRDNNGQTLIIENIKPSGAAEDEIAELNIRYTGYQCTGLMRLSFWNCLWTSASDMEHLSNNNLLGYAIIKKDSIPGKPAQWHIFESVFRKYAHKHNCIPNESTFSLCCGTRHFSIEKVKEIHANVIH